MKKYVPKCLQLLAKLFNYYIFSNYNTKTVVFAKANLTLANITVRDFNKPITLLSTIL